MTNEYISVKITNENSENETVLIHEKIAEAYAKICTVKNDGADRNIPAAYIKCRHIICVTDLSVAEIIECIAEFGSVNDQRINSQKMLNNFLINEIEKALNGDVDNTEYESRTFKVTLSRDAWQGIDMACDEMKKDGSDFLATDIDDAVVHLVDSWATALRRPGSWERGCYQSLGLVPFSPEFSYYRESWSA